MIYVASLSAPVKKAFVEKCYSTNIANIIEQMKLDPSVSGMDACVLGSKDVVGVNRAKVQTAIRTKHPNVCVIYIYVKDKEADLLDVPFKVQLKKVNEETVSDAVLQYMDEHLVSKGKTVVSRDQRAARPIVSKPTDRALPTGGMKGNLFKKAASQATDPETDGDVDVQFDPALGLYYYLDPIGQMVYCNKETLEPLSKAEVQAKKDSLKAGEEVTATEEEDFDEDDIPVNLGGQKLTEPPKVEPPVSAPVVPPMDFQQRTATSLEKNIMSVSDFHDWGLLKQQLTKDEAVRQLLEENSTFQGTVQMLSVLDTDIKAVYYDSGLTSQQKFEKILEIGSNRSVLVATHNDILARKVLDIMEAVTISARRTVEDLLMEHRTAMEQLMVSEEAIGNEQDLLALIQRRSEAEFELLAVIKGIIMLYQAMDMEVNEIIMDLDKRIPSDNDFINNMIGSAADILTPTNTKEVAHTLMKALQGKCEVMALLQDSVDKVIDSIHNMLASDQAIIDYQQHMIKMLKAHRVEDAVVIDGIIKNILNIYVGSDNTGRTATTLTWSGVLSRRRNTLLIDLTGNNKLRDYGVEVIQLDEFMRSRIDRPFCVVEGYDMDMEDLGDMVRELKTRLDYYGTINVVLSTSQLETIQVLAEEAYTLNFITNCTNESITDIAECYKQVTTGNIARKLLMVDPPLDVLKLASRIGADVTMTKCVTIPNLNKIKMCALTNDAPYEYSEVRTVFEEAFR